MKQLFTVLFFTTMLAGGTVFAQTSDMPNGNRADTECVSSSTQNESDMPNGNRCRTASDATTTQKAITSKKQETLSAFVSAFFNTLFPGLFG